MKRTIIMALLLFFAIGTAQVQAQNAKQQERQAKKEAKAKEKADREAEKQARAAQIAAENMAAFTKARQAIEDRDFVLEGQQVQFARGDNFFVNPNTNFIQVQGKTATVQISSNYGTGANGLGGITVTGNMSDVTYNVDVDGNVAFSMMVLGSSISAKVELLMHNGSNTANVTVSPNFNSRRMTMVGAVVPSSESNVFEGVSR